MLHADRYDDYENSTVADLNSEISVNLLPVCLQMRCLPRVLVFPIHNLFDMTIFLVS